VYRSGRPAGRVSTETLRRWVRQNQGDVGERDGVSSEMARENRELKRKNRELEETAVILISTAR
jgi:transposase